VPLGKDGAGGAEMMDDDQYEEPMTETEAEADSVRESDPVDDGGMYREIDE